MFLLQQALMPCGIGGHGLFGVQDRPRIQVPSLWPQSSSLSWEQLPKMQQAPSVGAKASDIWFIGAAKKAGGVLAGLVDVG